MTTANVPAVNPKPAIDWTSIDTPIKHEGKAIVLPGDPAPMDYDAAIANLQRVKKDEQTEFNVTEQIDGGPWDALVCIYQAMQAIYGVVTVTGTPTWFGKMRPDMISVRTGPGPADVVQVPIGQMNLPNVDKPIQIKLNHKGAQIAGTVRKRERALLVELANKAREIIRFNSIYRGKALRIGIDDDGGLQLNEQPRFLDVAGVQETDMIHTAETAMMIRTNIFAPLKNTEACRQHRIPLKRGILLEGRYGTGKSLTARVTAKVATENRWTFIMLDRVQGLKAALDFARNYQPCVIFAEDIDRAADRDNEDVNDLVNLLDGVATKDSEVMVVLTTNFVENIDRALLRPGRFDAVISIQSPDADTVQRLVRAYGRDLISGDIDLTGVGSALIGQIPATVREVVERAKLSMLTEDRQHLSADDLLASALGMKRHLDLLNPPEAIDNREVRLWAALTEVIGAAIGGDKMEITADLKPVMDAVRGVAGAVGQTSRQISAVGEGVDTVMAGTAAVMDQNQTIARQQQKVLEKIS